MFTRDCVRPARVAVQPPLFEREASKTLPLSGRRNPGSARHIVAVAGLILNTVLSTSRAVEQYGGVGRVSPSFDAVAVEGSNRARCGKNLVCRYPHTDWWLKTFRCRPVLYRSDYEVRHVEKPATGPLRQTQNNTAIVARTAEANGRYTSAR